jgi:hypothetical protein
MKQLSTIILTAALAIPGFAQETKTNAPAADAQMAGQILPISAAIVTAPLVLTNAALTMTGDQTEITNGGKAVFTFTIATAGNYVFETLVNAPADNSNSFFANVDAPPEDPDMIWDIDITMGYEKRLLSWRGNGDSATAQFAPKRFTLTPGAHKLILVGREPDVLLKSVSVRPAPPEK